MSSLMFNIIFGLIVPWLFGIFHLNRKERTLIPTIGPFVTAFSLLINELGFFLGFWKIKPFYIEQTISAMPFDFGFYLIVKCYMIYFIKNSKYSYLILFIFAFFTTVVELTLVSFEIVIYGNGWNIVWTFFSYFIPNIIVYWFYLYLVKLKILK